MWLIADILPVLQPVREGMIIVISNQTGMNKPSMLKH
jgi:hypothetical protein